uniref:HTH CENPB-type domain-containing protein n=1 Tax=Bionectria ochroleuca TaxID=29856 RepID=A0A8H7ND60_BIOOC
MKSWKVAAPEIRSRCGFCGIVMDTWTIRVDHLAEHFKTGYSMADWKGDWGFDSSVLDMVENSVPPYLIHHERNSPLPYVASQPSPQSPRNAYELIKLELEYFTANYLEQNGTHPTDEELMVEGCRIIYASELLSLQGIASEVSWLRDVIMKIEELALKARFGPLRGATENRLATLKINGKDNLFELCPLEFQLQEFVRAKRLLGLTAMDYELQQEACRIVGRVEEVSVHPSDIVANWLLRLIRSSTHWLADFRRRAHLPRTEDVKNDTCRSNDPTVIDSTIHSYTRLESELRDFLRDQRALGLEPTDEDLQRQARIIIYEFDDGWNQTAADNASWLRAFKERHLHDLSPAVTETSPGLSLTKTHPSTTTDTPITLHSPDAVRAAPKALDVNGNLLKLTPFFLNDANCYRRLSKELGRWVAATMSPNNPNQHVPSDEELKHQARYIIYESDDPWNQTAADNAEWLQRFKRDSGIINDAGPGLPECSAWAVEQGGSGFAPLTHSPRASSSRSAAMSKSV